MGNLCQHGLVIQETESKPTGDGGRWLTPTFTIKMKKPGLKSPGFFYWRGTLLRREQLFVLARDARGRMLSHREHKEHREKREELEPGNEGLNFTLCPLCSCMFPKKSKSSVKSSRRDA